MVVQPFDTTEWGGPCQGYLKLLIEGRWGRIRPNLSWEKVVCADMATFRTGGDMRCWKSVVHQPHRANF